MNKIISKIAYDVGTPFFLFYPRTFKSNLDDFNNAFKKLYSNVLVAYSFKTNYIPFICKCALEGGAYAEVVSGMEYNLALKIGFPPNHIIFNGPLKRYDDFYYAISNGSIINLDSMYEIEYLKLISRQHPLKDIKIGVRVNFDMTCEDGFSPRPDGKPYSRFGFCFEDGTLDKALSTIKEIENVSVDGLHGHASTTTRGIKAFENITEVLCNIAATRLNGKINYIDVGGGFYGKLPASMQDTPTPLYGDYSKAITNIIKQYSFSKQPYLILEPGMAVVADTMSYVTKVIEIKTIDNEIFVQVDGSSVHAKPTFHNRNLPFKIISKVDNSDNDALNNYHMVGFTCMEKDTIMSSCCGQLPQIGDLIKIDNTGAYTVVMSQPFIDYYPPIIAIDNQTFKIIRKRATIDTMFSTCSF